MVTGVLEEVGKYRKLQAFEWAKRNPMGGDSGAKSPHQIRDLITKVQVGL